jgi:hypothetical protein
LCNAQWRLREENVAISSPGSMKTRDSLRFIN